MSTVFDNMGGFISAEFILQNELLFFAPIGVNRCRVDLQNGKSWKLLDAKHEGISLTVNASDTDAGLLYDISGSIILKKTSVYLDILRLNRSILIKYTDTDMIEKIAGTDEYPLQATLSPLTPTARSDFFGYELKFTGQQLIEPPVISN